MATWFVASVLIILGFVKKAKRKALNGEIILSLYYHAPSKELFEFCVTWLKKNNFHFIDQQDILAIAQGEKPFPKGGVVITVDDGWQSNKESVVAIANKYQVPVTIFVSTEPIQNGNYWWPYVNEAINRNLTQHNVEGLKKIPNTEREMVLTDIKQQVILPRQAMTVDEIIEISKSEWVTIGGHTVTHPILPNCDDAQAHFEIKESKVVIERWISKEIKTFAYPNGDYSEREIRILKGTGFELAYTTLPLLFNEDCLKDRYTLPRYAIIENISKAEAICRMFGVWQRFF